MCDRAQQLRAAEHENNLSSPIRRSQKTAVLGYQVESSVETVEEKPPQKHYREELWSALVPELTLATDCRWGVADCPSEDGWRRVSGGAILPIHHRLT